MLSKEPWLDRDLQDYLGLDDDDEEENHLSVQGGREVVSFPDVDEGERQSAWADPLHGELCRLHPTNSSNEHEAWVLQLVTQVIWN